MDSKKGQQVYEQYVNEITPKANLPMRMFKAFLVGGIICCIGQFLVEVLKNYAGMTKDDATAYCTLILVLSSVILTGLGIYRKIA